MASFNTINIRSPAGRLFGIALFAVAVAVGNDGETFWLWRGIGYEQTVYAPFLTLLLISAVAAFVLGNSAIKAIQDVAVPVGVVTSCCNILLVLSKLDEPSKLIFDLRLMYAPLVLGLIVSYLLQIFFEDTINSRRHPSTTISVLFLLAMPVSFALVLDPLIGLEKHMLLGSPETILSVVAIMFIAFSAVDSKERNGLDIAADSGLIIVIAACVLGVAYYTIGMAHDSPEVMGPAIQYSMGTMSLGAGVIWLCSTLGATAATKSDCRLRDWHLAECYVFISLIMFPPLSIVETASYIGEFS